MMRENAESAGFPGSYVGTLESREDLRCICNRLVCKIQGCTIEIKCARCKRILQIRTHGIDRIEYL